MFKRKKVSKIFKFLLSFFQPQIEYYLAEYTAKGIERARQILEDSYSKSAELTTNLLMIGYPFVDTIIEDWAKKTKTPYDDQLVVTLKTLLEEFAASKGLTLPNLDAD